MAVIFADGEIRTSSVEPNSFVREGKGGNICGVFCPECGTRIYHQWFNENGNLPFFILKPGTLDDTSWVKPGCHVWAKSRQPWVTFALDDVVFEEQPTLSEWPRYKDAVFEL